MIYLAHSKNATGQRQELEVHLQNVAELAAKFGTSLRASKLAVCRREGKPPFFLPPLGRVVGIRSLPTPQPGGRNGADNQCSAPYFCSLRQTARRWTQLGETPSRAPACLHRPPDAARGRSTMTTRSVRNRIMVGASPCGRPGLVYDKPANAFT